MKSIYRFVLMLAIAVLAGPLASVQAMTLDELSTKLAAHPVVRGSFTQDKHMRGLPQPFRSQGSFVLARTQGLLWLLQTPLKQDYRILAGGIEQRTPQGWQPLRQQAGLGQQSRLFIAVLQGDHAALQRDFTLALDTQADRWTLTLTPKQGFLREIFENIRITGATFVERIELREAQGDSTVLTLTDSDAKRPLSSAERDDLGL